MSDKFNVFWSNKRGLFNVNRPDWWPGSEFEFPAPGVAIDVLGFEVVGSVKAATVLFVLVDDCCSIVGNGLTPVDVDCISTLGFVSLRWARLNEKRLTDVFSEFLIYFALDTHLKRCIILLDIFRRSICFSLHTISYYSYENFYIIFFSLFSFYV